MTVSNRRPSRCKRDALPTELTALSWRPVPAPTLYFRPREAKPSRSSRHDVPAGPKRSTHTPRHRKRAISSDPLPPISWLPRALAALLFRRLLRIQARLQGGAGFETRVLRGRDLDLLPGGRIAAFASGALAHREGAEADQSELRRLLRRSGDAWPSTASSAVAALTFVNSASLAMCSTSSSLFIWPLLCLARRCRDVARLSRDWPPPPSHLCQRIDAWGEP